MGKHKNKHKNKTKFRQKMTLDPVQLFIYGWPDIKLLQAATGIQNLTNVKVCQDLWQLSNSQVLFILRGLEGLGNFSHAQINSCVGRMVRAISHLTLQIQL